jgi:hypothetical protein
MLRIAPLDADKNDQAHTDGGDGLTIHDNIRLAYALQ